MKILDLDTHTQPVSKPTIVEQVIDTEDEEITVYGYDLKDPKNEKFANYLKYIKKANPHFFNKIISLN